MKGYLITIIIAVILILAILFIFRFIIGGNEDSWIKDNKGIWIKHGNPSKTPDYVKEQQNAITCALGLYEEKKNSGMNFSSQCLGTCGNYSIDIVHVPRTSDDNLAENQCEDFKLEKTHYFIELDKDGNIFRIV